MKQNRRWMEEQSGIGTLEMMLIIALVLVVAIAFRKWIMAWIDGLFASTDTQVNNTMKDNTIRVPK